MKICSHCHIEKEESEFGTHINKRPRKDGVLTSYIKGTCKKCDSARNMVLHNKKKNDPEYLEKNRIRATKWREENIERVNKKQAIKRNTPEWKEYMREWHKNHRELTRQGARRRNKKYIEEITPMYAKNKIQFSYWKQGIKISHSELTDEMVEIKIKQLKSCRTQKELSNSLKNQ